MNIENKYQELWDKPSDINEHFPVLRRYAGECKHITEMGVRGIVSTFALLAGQPLTMISYDIRNCDWKPVQKAAREQYYTRFRFKIGDTRIVTIEPTELLFIDTLHNYDQLTIELKRHAPKVSKYIILHDTTTYAYIGEGYDGKERKGLWPAIEEFLERNPEWIIKERFTNNNGLTVLAKK